jgi:lambda repressor-like predicted transcriptional regulator
MYKVQATDPHPDLVPLLEKYGISWELFSKKGRLPNDLKWVKEKRSSVITEMHSKGTSWGDMIEITGLSLGSIERLTKAMWNKASRENSSAIGIRVGKSWKGKHRPGQLERQWAVGTFDFHRGRIRPEWELEKIRASWTPELRLRAGEHAREIWSDPVCRAKILAFHRSPEERARLSRLQAQRMLDYPNKYSKGRSEWVPTLKGVCEKAFARSSYEVAAITMLEADPSVVRYEHEHRFVLENGHWALPDFLVQYADGHMLLVEVKASWVLGLPSDYKIQRRLEVARQLADTNGWGFAIWTERELKNVNKSAI